MKPSPRSIQLMRLFSMAAAWWLGAVFTPAHATPDAAVWAQVQTHKQPLLDTLKDLVAIESGSGDREGLDRISQLIHDRLLALGGQVDFIEPGPDTYRQDRPHGARHIQGHGQQEDLAHRAHGHGVLERHGRQATLSH
jgi:hypothetical protein